MDNNHETNALQHHGVKGQKWGVRRYQNKDGSLTALGEKRAGRKTAVDKKAIENLKDQRAARYLNVVKQRQAMRQEALDRANARKLARGKLALEKQKAKEDALDKENARKLANDKLKIDKKDQRDRSLDKASDRDIAKQKLRMELEALRDRNKTTTKTNDEYYELPDTPERQKESSNNGKKVAAAALTVAGTAVLAVAIKKYGPTIMSRISSMFGRSGRSDSSGDGTSGDISDIASEIFREAGRHSSSVSGLLGSSGGSSSDTTAETAARVMDSLADIPLYMGS